MIIDQIPKETRQFFYDLFRYMFVFIQDIDLREIGARSLIKLEKLKALIEGNATVDPDQWDSDNDLAEHEFQLGEKIDM